MCPKTNGTKAREQLAANSTMIDKLKWKFAELHRITIFALVLYLIFVIIFVCVNVLTCVWNYTIRRTKHVKSSRRPAVFERDLATMPF